MQTNNKSTPYIFDIVKGSFIDGPGIRSVVFFKGCPLRCVWCHNPESMEREKEFLYEPELCIGCGNHLVGKKCFTNAFKEVGKSFSVDEIVNIVLEDKEFYKSSNGGVTFSGGEPTLHMGFLGEACKKLKNEGIHITIHTCGMFSYGDFKEAILPYIDLIYFDLKIFNEVKHKIFTGSSNKSILSNLKKLSNEKIELIPRITLIQGITATDVNIIQIGDFLKSLNIKKAEFLPYNPSGLAKWEKLGKNRPCGVPEDAFPSYEQDRVVNLFKSVFSDRY